MTDGKTYANALFLLTEERGSSDKVADDLRTLAAVLRAEEDYVRLLDSPIVRIEEKLSLIDEAFPAFDGDLISLIKILTEKRSARLLPSVAKEYLAAYDDARGILRVEAITAVPMSDAQSERMAKKLAAETGKTIIIRNTVEPEVLGGVRLRYAGKQLDDSISTRLSTLEKALKAATV